MEKAYEANNGKPLTASTGAPRVKSQPTQGVYKLVTSSRLRDIFPPVTHSIPGSTAIEVLGGLQ